MDFVFSIMLNNLVSSTSLESSSSHVFLHYSPFQSVFFSPSSEVQYVVLQNVATMTIKRRVSYIWWYFVCVRVCFLTSNIDGPAGSLSILWSLPIFIFHRGCLNRTWRASTSAPQTRPRSKSLRFLFSPFLLPSELSWVNWGLVILPN